MPPLPGLTRGCAARDNSFQEQMHVKALTKLKELSISRSAVTDDGVVELERALPGLKVDR
ncbi:MAG TPA: hypothetical protein VGH74_00840 [Planctomycetaceae bacterium]